MQLFDTLSILAVINLAAAAPAPAHEESVFHQTDPWYIVGYDKPNCEGSPLWNEAGSFEACRDVSTLAASYLWRVSQGTLILTWPKPQVADQVCHGEDIEAVRSSDLKYVGPEAEDVGTMTWGCHTTPVHGFLVDQILNNTLEERRKR